MQHPGCSSVPCQGLQQALRKSLIKDQQQTLENRSSAALRTLQDSYRLDVRGVRYRYLSCGESKQLQEVEFGVELESVLPSALQLKQLGPISEAPRTENPRPRDPDSGRG